MNRNGIIGTTVFHGLILILLIFFGFSTPLPLPGEEGILINFGDNTKGLGNNEPTLAEARQKEAIQSPAPPVETVKSDKPEEIMTQDFEDAPVIKTKKEPAKKKTEEKVKEVTKPVEKPVSKEKKKEEKPQVDTRKLYTGKNTGTNESGSQGITEPGGNQGSTEGSADSDSYIGNGLGNEGVSFSLEGRGKVFLPEPSLTYQQQGVVVVEILVDRDGNVVSAREGVRGSTTTNVTLLKLAKEAALKSKFTSKDNAPVHQKGYIRYTFKLN